MAIGPRLDREFEAAHDRATSPVRKAILSAVAGGIAAFAAALVWSDKAPFTITLWTISGAVFGGLAGIVLSAVDSYEKRVEQARASGGPAPSNAKMMLVYALWIIGILFLIIIVPVAWIVLS